jgi:hypothetical protein
VKYGILQFSYSLKCEVTLSIHLPCTVPGCPLGSLTGMCYAGWLPTLAWIFTWDFVPKPCIDICHLNWSVCSCWRRRTSCMLLILKIGISVMLSLLYYYYNYFLIALFQFLGAVVHREINLLRLTWSFYTYKLFCFLIDVEKISS